MSFIPKEERQKKRAFLGMPVVVALFGASAAPQFS